MYVNGIPLTQLVSLMSFVWQLTWFAGPGSFTTHVGFEANKTKKTFASGAFFLNFFLWNHYHHHFQHLSLIPLNLTTALLANYHHSSKGTITTTHSTNAFHSNILLPAFWTQHHTSFKLERKTKRQKKKKKKTGNFASSFYFLSKFTRQNTYTRWIKIKVTPRHHSYNSNAWKTHCHEDCSQISIRR